MPYKCWHIMPATGPVFDHTHPRLRLRVGFAQYLRQLDQHMPNRPNNTHTSCLSTCGWRRPAGYPHTDTRLAERYH